jgi:hypothetical protein
MSIVVRFEERSDPGYYVYQCLFVASLAVSSYRSVLNSTKGLASRRAYAELAAARTDIELRSSILGCVYCIRWEISRSLWKLFVFGGDDGKSKRRSLSLPLTFSRLQDF